MSEEIIKVPENGAEPVRTIEVITAEIVTIKRQAQQIALYIAIELGRRLTEAKEMLDHGQWGDWLKESVGFSHESANRYMRLFREYAAPQNSLFGAEINSSTLTNLSVSKALALLAVPAEEREAFAAENQVDELSTREMDALIEDYKARLKKEEDARIRAEVQNQGIEFALNKARKDAEKAEAARAALEQQVKTLEARPVEVAVQEPDPEELKRRMDAAVAEATGPLKAEAKELRAQLKEATAKADALAKEVETGKKSAEAAADAIAERERLKAALQEAEKKLSMADSAVAVFKVRFDEAQVMLNEALAGVKGMGDAEARANCKAAAVKLLETFLDRFREVA